MTLDMGSWVTLSVCQTCELAVAGVLEIHEDPDQRSADALERWTGWHLWMDCQGDGCDSVHLHLCDCDDRDPDGHTPCADGHHAGGFTHAACDLCGVHGREDTRAYAEPVTDGAKPPSPGWGPVHEINAASLDIGDLVVECEGGITGRIAAIDYSAHGIYARVGEQDYLSAPRDEQLLARFWFD